MIEAAFILLASGRAGIWGAIGSAAVRIGEDHELVRTGPYRLLRQSDLHGVLGMCVGRPSLRASITPASSAMVLVAYIRKSRLEEQILRKTFGAEYDSYRAIPGRWCRCCTSCMAPQPKNCYHPRYCQPVSSGNESLFPICARIVARQTGHARSSAGGFTASKRSRRHLWQAASFGSRSRRRPNP